MKYLPIFLWFELTIACVGVARSQSWDSSGNALLKGNYNFRQLVVRVNNTAGNIGEKLALYGAISFDGNGNYVMNGTGVKSPSLNAQPFTFRGVYSIAESGYGFMSSPVAEGDFIYGLVSNGIFVGSSTENGVYNDLLVAVTSASSQPNSAFQGSYTAAYLNLTGATPQLQFDARVICNPDGHGGLGTLNSSVYMGTATTPVDVSQPNVTYTFNNGTITASIPGAAASGVGGQQLWYLSPDGTFFVGGSAAGWDMILGVRAGTTGAQSTLAGLYYQAGLDRDESQLAVQAYATVDSYYGSFVTVPNNGIVGHARLVSTFDGVVRDYTYRETFSPDSSGYKNSSTSAQYVLSADGSISIGLGIGPFLGISVAIRAPSFSGTGVYLNPVGLQNSASSAPFTASIAPGELILLNGTNLANNLFINLNGPFPTSLSGVQVLINNVPAPIYFIAAKYISVVVPYQTAPGVAQLQVINNGVSSNVITAFVGKTAPGVFTNPPGGIGRAIVQHLDYSLVTAENPARPGETLLAYVTGTGSVSPAISDGAVGPTDPLSRTTDMIAARIDKLPASVLFSGLVPTLSGLYAVLLVVPNGVRSGDVSLEISGSDSSTSEAVLAVGGTRSTGNPAAMTGLRSLLPGYRSSSSLATQ